MITLKLKKESSTEEPLDVPVLGWLGFNVWIYSLPSGYSFDNLTQRNSNRTLLRGSEIIPPVNGGVDLVPLVALTTSQSRYLYVSDQSLSNYLTANGLSTSASNASSWVTSVRASITKTGSNIASIQNVGLRCEFALENTKTNDHAFADDVWEVVGRRFIIDITRLSTVQIVKEFQGKNFSNGQSFEIEGSIEDKSIAGEFVLQAFSPSGHSKLSKDVFSLVSKGEVTIT